MNPPVYPSCCENGIVEWREASELYGPEKNGWSINIDTGMYGDANYVEVNYCPFCGAKLPESPDVKNDPA